MQANVLLAILKRSTLLQEPPGDGSGLCHKDLHSGDSPCRVVAREVVA